MIRTAVGKELSGRFDGGGIERSDLQEELDERVVQNLDSVENILKNVQRQVGDIEENTERQSNVGRYTRLEIYSAVPKGKEDALTLAEVSDRLGDAFTPTDISVMIEEFDDIHTVKSDEGTKFYRVE